jgi:hypothetical protein
MKSMKRPLRRLYRYYYKYNIKIKQTEPHLVEERNSKKRDPNVSITNKQAMPAPNMYRYRSIL